MASNQSLDTKPSYKRGRPSYTPGEQKKPRNLTITNEAWENLEIMSREFGLGSVSQLVENLGMRRIRAVNTSSDNNKNSLEGRTIHVKIKSLLNSPSAVFSSLISFVTRTVQQFGLDQDEEMNELVCKTLEGAIAVIFFIDYLCPERYINNPSAYIRALSYRFLLARHQVKKTKKGRSLKLNSYEIDVCISQIRHMLSMLESARSKNFSVLRMKVIDNLTWGQIKKILALQGEELSEEELRARVKIGLAQLREEWTTVSGNILVTDSSPEKPKPGETYARRYLTLLCNFDIEQEESWKDIESFLFDSKDEVAIDFWLNEIDYYLEFVREKPSSLDLQDNIRVRIQKEIDPYLEERILLVNQVFKTCVNRDDVRYLLLQIAKLEANTNIDPKDWLEQVTEIGDVKTAQLQTVQQRFEQKLDYIAQTLEQTYTLDCSQDKMRPADKAKIREIREDALQKVKESLSDIKNSVHEEIPRICSSV